MMYTDKCNLLQPPATSYLHARYLHQMVTQRQVCSCIVGFLICLRHMLREQKIPIYRNKCATCSVLPSYISTMRTCLCLDSQQCFHIRTLIVLEQYTKFNFLRSGRLRKGYNVFLIFFFTYYTERITFVLVYFLLRTFFTSKSQRYSVGGEGGNMPTPLQI